MRTSSGLCTWTATSDVDWISVTSNANGKGSPPVDSTFHPRQAPPRTGMLTIAGSISRHAVGRLHVHGHSVGTRGGRSRRHSGADHDRRRWLSLDSLSNAVDNDHDPGQAATGPGR